jgi:predicted acetyltransferase
VLSFGACIGFLLLPAICYRHYPATSAIYQSDITLIAGGQGRPGQSTDAPGRRLSGVRHDGGMPGPHRGLTPKGRVHLPQLTKPSTDVRDSFLAAARELRDEGWLPAFPVDEVAADFAGYVERVLDEKQAWGVPVTTLWYTDGPAYLGTVVIRHRLTPELTRHGGHIGYHVAPRRRRQGHATVMLAAAVSYCRDILGIARVLVTCDQSNAGSRQVIESNGGVLENVLDDECRYWISPGG